MKYLLTCIRILTKHRLNDVYMSYVTICEISFFDSKSQYFCIMLNVLYRYSVRWIDNKSRVSAIPIEKTYTKSSSCFFFPFSINIHFYSTEEDIHPCRSWRTLEKFVGKEKLLIAHAKT